MKRHLYAGLPAVLAIALGTAPAVANTVTFAGTDFGNDVSVSGSFSFASPPDAVSDWSDITSFVITFTPFDGSANPAATFSLADLPTIAAESTQFSFSSFSYDGSTTDLNFEYDGLDYSYNYYGFDLYTGDGVGYSYGVDGTQYEGTLAGYTVTETAPEPASLTLFGVGLLGAGVVRRKRRAV